jgi:deoxyribose-phosphate aldolase
MGTSSVSDRAQMVKRAIRLIDLTDLADDSSAEAVEALCAEAVAQHTAAVCIWPEFVATAARTLNGSGVMIATVVNFPSGEERAPAVSAAAARAVADGADEIDVVLPWRAWMEGQTQRAADVLDAVRAAVPPPIVVKVIIESGELGSPVVVGDAARFAIAHGADFVKTSTGKTALSATPEAVSAILDAVSASDRPVGVKASGGIRKVDQALKYLEQVDASMGEGWATPGTFRFGASGLLAALVEEQSALLDPLR